MLCVNLNKKMMIQIEVILRYLEYIILNQETELNSDKNNYLNQKLNIKTINKENIFNRKNNKYNNEKPLDLDLYATNCYLKNIEKQKRLHYPNKDYSSNYNLIIEELGGELKKLSENIKTEKKNKFNDFFNPKQKKKNPIKLNNLNNFNFITQSNRSIDDIFITSNKNLFDNNNLNEKINIYNDNKYKNKMKIVKRPRNANFSLNLKDKNRNMNKKVTQIIIKKLNLRPKINLIEVADVRKKLKLTEYIVFNHAKRKLMFEGLGKNELFEYVNNNKINKKE